MGNEFIKSLSVLFALSSDIAIVDADVEAFFNGKESSLSLSAIDFSSSSVSMIMDDDLRSAWGKFSMPLKMQKKSLPPVTLIIAISSKGISYKNHYN